MKILNKGTIAGFLVGLVATIGLVYAAQNITSLTQTAQTGDKLTASWINAVNNKLNSVNASGSGPFCVDTSTTEKCKTALKTYGVPSSAYSDYYSKIYPLENKEVYCYNNGISYAFKIGSASQEAVYSDYFCYK
ncbi:hypothetical protein H3C61_04750 [Candidatus Gracilibacteria bacterium]|nr:hypothetical protein [Candidatus Gracilibacteria bacterium]